MPTTGTDTTKLFYHLRKKKKKNHAKEHKENLQMGNKKEPSSVNKPQTEMLEQVLACGTPHNKDSLR